MKLKTGPTISYIHYIRGCLQECVHLKHVKVLALSYHASARKIACISKLLLMRPAVVIDMLTVALANELQINAIIFYFIFDRVNSLDL